MTDQHVYPACDAQGAQLLDADLKPLWRVSHVPLDGTATYRADQHTLDAIAAIVHREVHAALLLDMEDQRAWEEMFSKPHVQAGLERLEEEAKRQFAAGEYEEGGFAVEDADVSPLTMEDVEKRAEMHIVYGQDKRSHYVHRLEHMLKSCTDFMENPSIAGNAYQVISAYTESLVKTVRALLDSPDEENAPIPGGDRIPPIRDAHGLYIQCACCFQLREITISRANPEMATVLDALGPFLRRCECKE
jgi:hypothetical protein